MCNDKFAVVDNAGRYLCTQGRHDWFDDECKGWAICTDDRNFADYHADKHGATVVGVARVEGKWTAF